MSSGASTTLALSSFVAKIALIDSAMSAIETDPYILVAEGTDSGAFRTGASPPTALIEVPTGSDGATSDSGTAMGTR